MQYYTPKLEEEVCDLVSLEPEVYCNMQDIPSDLDETYRLCIIHMKVLPLKNSLPLSPGCLFGCVFFEKIISTQSVPQDQIPPPKYLILCVYSVYWANLFDKLILGILFCVSGRYELSS